ncbi:galactosylgalactosylxylosylprotein 3-beta-glucuronosyltransferase 2 [Microcaecilia unicolor]|uniref:Galactosylgalactosylxylosylprotein 3-beta-glucuronosyltransferase n=1 Tax=Microcaecilia unicolor TaxID=1415580 RepID=A0A6P7XW02_9AMPH|nr:galactosylgalactosylxylosylprotein 3-beta-glucuronosyltransferase 2 [Microcaecilia unicolor]
MKTLFYSRFFIILPWVLIVIIMIDVDTRSWSSSSRSPASPHRPHQHPPAFGHRLGRGARLLKPPAGGSSSGSGSSPPAALGNSKAAVVGLVNESVPLIYAITPTYSRPVQKAELTRLANTFRQVARLHWVLVEDSTRRTELVSRFVARAGLPCTHLHVPTPRRYKRAGLPRATEQRNAGLAWLRQQFQQRPRPRPPPAGVLFFADDDNTYSLELFHEMRTTRKVSVWPVGLVGGRRYERPIVENGKVVGWYTGWRADRPFAIDMAGFAVSLQVILANPKAVFKRRGSQPGMQESDFLKQITTVEELEPKADNCTKVLVWHTRTEKVNLANEPKYHVDTVKIEV